MTWSKIKSNILSLQDTNVGKSKYIINHKIFERLNNELTVDIYIITYMI